LEPTKPTVESPLSARRLLLYASLHGSPQTLPQTQLLQTQQPIFDLLGQQLAPASNAGTPPSPIIDFSTRFSLPTTASQVLAVDSKNKPWLSDYLGNVGQARKGVAKCGFEDNDTRVAGGEFFEKRHARVSKLNRRSGVTRGGPQ
jgi:hypothetical protein